jgi:hypothetical protein
MAMRPSFEVRAPSVAVKVNESLPVYPGPGV